MKITTEVEIPAQRIADIMVSAMEQNHMTRAWVAAVRLRSPTEGDVRRDWKENNWYASPQLWAGEFEIDVWEIKDESIYEGGFDPEDDVEPDVEIEFAKLETIGLRKHTITNPDLVVGMKLWANGKYAHHFADFMAENDDAITADVLLQLIVLKDVVYG